MPNLPNLPNIPSSEKLVGIGNNLFGSLGNFGKSGSLKKARKIYDNAKRKYDQAKKIYENVKNKYDKYKKIYEEAKAKYNDAKEKYNAARDYLKSLEKSWADVNRLRRNSDCMSPLSYGLASACLAQSMLADSYILVNKIRKKEKNLGFVPNGALENYKHGMRTAAHELMDRFGCQDEPPVAPTLVSIIDPSGYVYEAVESNRVVGVTATVFENVVKTDKFGDEYNVSEVWNAKLYGQENPLITNNEGFYQWDVPIGWWQVKYEKLNYETTYSKWLQVPPPQLDVNVPIISYVQPEINRITGYDTRIEIEFSKYMIPDSLNLDNIVITKDDKIISGIIALTNEEIDPNKESTTYSSKINFVFNESLKMNDIVTVLIKKEVESYAGVRMNSDYSKSITLILEPKISFDSETTNITYGKINEFNYLITISPAEGIQGHKLFLNSDFKEVIDLESDSILINNDGIINITAKVGLPGLTHIEMEVEGTAIKAVKTINVELPKSKLENVTASIEPDMCLLPNTPIELYTRTPDSVIYYKTNKSLDSNEYELYSGSIIINKNMIVSAIGKHDNYLDSDPIFLNYSVCNFYTITFNDNNGNTFSKEVIESRKYGDLPTPPIKEYYTFDGWFTDVKDGFQITNESNVNITQNITLYAKWIPLSFTITFETFGGSMVKSITQQHGTAITEPEAPIKDGFIFSGWYEDPNLSKKYEFTHMPTKNITLYAKWVNFDILTSNDDINRISDSEITDVPTDAATNEILKSATINDVPTSNTLSSTGTTLPMTNIIATDIYAISETNEITETKNGSKNSTAKNNGKLIGIIAGCVIGAVIIIAIVIVLVIIYIRKKRDTNSVDEAYELRSSII